MLEYWSGPHHSTTPVLHHSNGWVAVPMMKLGYSIAAFLLALTCLDGSRAAGQEVFIGNPGKSLNFFHFDENLAKPMI